MDYNRNMELLKIATDITIAKVSNSVSPANQSTGEDASEYLHAIYKKLVELTEAES